MSPLKPSIHVMAGVALLGEMFAAHQMAAFTAQPEEGGLIAGIGAVFVVSLGLTLNAAIRGAAIYGAGFFAASGLGFLAGGIEYEESLYLILGLVFFTAGSVVAVLLRRLSGLTHFGESARTTLLPREGRTRLCRLTELDAQLLPLLEETTHRYSLGDLRATARVCCETGFLAQEGFPRRRHMVAAEASVVACVLTDRMVILLVLDGDANGVAFVGRLEQTVISGPTRADSSGMEHGVWVNSPWLGESTASSYHFPLEDNAAAASFVEEFRGLLATARSA